MCPSIPPPCKRAYNFTYSPLSSKDLWQFWKKKVKSIPVQSWNVSPETAGTFLSTETKWTNIPVQSWNVSQEKAATIFEHRKSELYNPWMFPKKKLNVSELRKKLTSTPVKSWTVSLEKAGTSLSTKKVNMYMCTILECFPRKSGNVSEHRKKKVNIYTCTILECFPKESKNASKHRKTWTSIPVQSWNVSPEKAGTFLSREVFGVPHCWLALQTQVK